MHSAVCAFRRYTVHFRIHCAHSGRSELRVGVANKKEEVYPGGFFCDLAVSSVYESCVLYEAKLTNVNKSVSTVHCEKWIFL